MPTNRLSARVPLTGRLAALTGLPSLISTTSTWLSASVPQLQPSRASSTTCVSSSRYICSPAAATGSVPSTTGESGRPMSITCNPRYWLKK